MLSAGWQLNSLILKILSSRPRVGEKKC
jgi:hypothetical protein